MKNRIPPILAVSLLLPSFVQAQGNLIPIRLNFTAGEFVSANGIPAPTNFVSGSIQWEATGVSDPVQSFDYISLSIDGHTYATAELGYRREDFPFVGIELIGGNLNGVGSMVAQTDDFWIRWDRKNLTPFDFAYSSSHLYDFWSAYESGPGTFTSFSIEEVPEPSAIVFVFSALVAFGIRKSLAERKQSGSRS